MYALTHTCACTYSYREWFSSWSCFRQTPEVEQISMISMELGCKFLFNVGFHSKKSFRFVVALFWHCFCLLPSRDSVSLASQVWQQQAQEWRFPAVLLTFARASIGAHLPWLLGLLPFVNMAAVRLLILFGICCWDLYCNSSRAALLCTGGDPVWLTGHKMQGLTVFVVMPGALGTWVFLFLINRTLSPHPPPAPPPFW